VLNRGCDGMIASMEPIDSVVPPDEETGVEVIPMLWTVGLGRVLTSSRGKPANGATLCEHS